MATQRTLMGTASPLRRVGMPVKARFRRLAQFKPTDVYFVPSEKA